MKITYRQVRKEDGYAWYTLINDVWRAAYAHIFPQEVFEERETWKEDKVREFTEEKFLGDRKIAYVAECDGKIIGVMFGTLDSVYEHFRGEYADHNEISYIGVERNSGKDFETLVENMTW